jgi:hypothetical protein
MSKIYYWFTGCFILLCLGYLFKIRYGLYLYENVQSTIVMVKDLQLSFFLIFISYKIYSIKSRKNTLIPNLNKNRKDKIGYEKLRENGAKDYIGEQRHNEEKLNNNEYELKKLENESDFIDGSILWLTIIACILQIASFFGQKI